MRSVITTPRDKNEFDIAFSLLMEFGKDRKRLSLEEDEEISFAFLMNETESTKEIAGKVDVKKSTR